MEKNILKTDQQDIISLLEDGYDVFRTDNPNLLLRMENKIIYQFNKDKKGNEINKEEWKVTQADFLSDDWSYIDEEYGFYLSKIKDYDLLIQFYVNNNIKPTDEELKYIIYLHSLLYNTSIKKDVGVFLFIDEDEFELAKFDISTNAYNFHGQLYTVNGSNSEFSDFIKNNNENIILLFKYFINKI